jgi:hypothetical protein
MQLPLDYSDTEPSGVPRARTATDGGNAYQRRTTDTKLRGQYFTPDGLVSLILDALPLTGRERIVDPSCGDGSFLRGAVAALRRRFPETRGDALARHWVPRIVGFDLDPAAVSEARDSIRAAVREQLGVDLDDEAVQVRCVDSLSAQGLDPLLLAAGLSPVARDERLLVVGNPPYVEAKRLDAGSKSLLKARFPEAIEGAPDLYLYFLHACLGWLRADDHLAFVLPNKLLVNANARRLRERLLAEGTLDRLWLATQARLFGDAAVYPIVLFAHGTASGSGALMQATPCSSGTGSPGAPASARGTRRDPASSTHRSPTRRPLDCGPVLSMGSDEPAAPDLMLPASGPVRISRLTAAAAGLSIGSTLDIAPALFARSHSRAFFAPPEETVLREALERLLHAEPRLDEVLDIRWSVSFHRSGLRERYVTSERPDSPHARRFLGGAAFAGNGEVRRYRLGWAGTWIDYDETRLHSDGNVVPPLALFERPKVVICQNGRTLRATFDEEGFVLKDTFLCGDPRDVDHPLRRRPRALVGLLCSRAVHFFFSHVFYGGHVGGGYLHFLRSFLIDVPLGTWTDAGAERVEAQVRLLEQGPNCSAEAEIDAGINAALDLSPQEASALAAWCDADPNWQARERIRSSNVSSTD